ncbi:MAG TPA: MBL fold metallo-hydrolase [Puia sp.]
MKLDIHSDVLVWFGHSSYFIQLDGKRILVDPVFSGSASPFSFSVKAFEGTDIYTTDDIPVIDYLFISHDHWDHLDYETIIKLKPRVKKVICGLGTGEHLEYWGYHQDLIIEKDWDGQIDPGDGFQVHAVPARHFSGRGLIRNKAIWTAFVLQTPTMQILIGGDSGYDKHFAAIGEQFGPFDLVILENGQYDKSWKYIHMMPEEVLQAAEDLNAKRLLPVHSCKFAIANHAWDDPLKKITELGKTRDVAIITPRIGEAVYLKDPAQVFMEWWKNIK